MQPMLGWTAGLLLTSIFIVLMRPLAQRAGLVDRPTGRKNHTGNIPLVGGIAIALAMTLTLGLLPAAVTNWGLLAAGAALVFIGVWDDVSKVSSGARLTVQAAAVLTLIYSSGHLITDLGRIGVAGEILHLGWLAIPFTVFAGVGVINAINMSDGLDGLCGMLSLAALLGLGLVAALAGREQEFLVTAVLAGCVAGFLLFNLRFPWHARAKTFLGDGGSYLIGFVLACLTISLSQGGADRAMSPVTALWFCLVPLLDTVGMILRRLHRGRSPFSADREHLHHVFLLAGFTVTETVLVIAAVALLGVGIGLAGQYLGAPESLMLALFLTAGVAYYWMIMRAWKVMRFLSRSINRRVGRGCRRRIGDRRRQHDPEVLARIGRDRRAGGDRRHGDGDRRTGQSPGFGSTALQHRKIQAGGQPRRQTQHPG